MLPTNEDRVSAFRALPGTIWACNAVIWQVLAGPNERRNTHETQWQTDR